MPLTYTYDASTLATSQLMRARMRLGDVGVLMDASGSPVWLVSDEEIDGLIGLNGYQEAVAQIAMSLVARFAQEPDQYIDEAGVNVKWTARLAAWRELALEMRSGTGQNSQTLVPLNSIIGISKGPCMTGFK